ncbi:hypothetical protein ABIB06_002099 [Bradyrhizobium sp. LB8.2]|uniref:hypothetical protein n=1 Tax=unclassified Bradyrhizobium TaxID=2631580 RepID=UPI001FFB02E1|nr:hypothetical protein [Bradyrhizobium sp. 197]MCK1478227.1 hypothetical protein [Bradyrhizobium sp. 197]
MALVPAVEEESLVVELKHGDVVPGMVEPYVIVEVLGSGTVTNGLTPVLPVSVAPSGIELPMTDPLELAPGVDEPVAPADDEVQPEVISNPPPSKVVPAAVIDVVLFVPEDCEPVEPLAPQDGVGAGLRPPGSISVDPSGLPETVVPLVPFVPNTPSGEVAPIAEGLTEV